MRCWFGSTPGDDGVNFWEERDAPGRQTHQRLDDIRAARSDSGQFPGFVEKLIWQDPQNRPLLEEARDISWHASEGTTLLHWQSAFTVPKGRQRVQIGGARYHGFGMRFVQSMDATARFFN